MSVNESLVEDAGLERFGELGYEVGHGPHLAPGETAAERDSFGDVVLVIGAMQVALPNEPRILDPFYSTYAPFFEQIEADRIQSRTLATLRDTLLPKLLSGELSVQSNPK